MRATTRRRWRWTPTLVVVTAVAVVVGWWLEARTATVPTTLADAVAAWHQEGDGTDLGAASGVYAMDTTGQEQVAVLGGLGHQYPATTPVLVRVDGQGCMTWRWTPIAERWQERVTCPDAAGGGTRLVSIASLHAFMGREDRRRYRCDEDSVALPASPVAGATFSARCTSPSSDLSGPVTLTIEGRVAEVGTIDVAGTPQAVVRVDVEQTLSGDTTGTASYVRWLDPDTALVLREECRTATRSKSFVGTVTRTEEYTIALAPGGPYR